MIGSLIVSLFVGAIAGWLASIIMGTRNTLGVNILLGIVGGFVGNFIVGLLGFASYSIVSSILVSVLGACVLIFLVRKLR